MLFWIIATCLAAAVIACLAAPLWRGPAPVGAVAPAMAIYRDQLAEVERDLARGLLDPASAERTRTEVARRMLAADRTDGGPTPQTGPLRIVVLGLVIALGLGAGGLYLNLGAPGYPDLSRADRIAAGDARRATRISQAAAEALVPVALAPDVPAADMALIVQLRDAVQQQPDSVQGWAFLADYEARIGNYPAAARAQARLVALRGDVAELADHELLVDLQVAAAGGFVSPQVELTLRRLLAADPDNLTARYYTGLLYAKTDRPDIAYRLWRAMIEAAADPTDFHVNLARGQVEDAAFRAGVDYELPPAAATPGPTAADIAAAADLTPDQRQAMIAGMVAQLSDRLATQGGPVADWARLVASLATLGDMDQARAILAEAREVFATDRAALDLLDQTATQAELGR